MAKGFDRIQREIKTSNLIRVTFLVTLIIGVFIVSFRGWINDQYQIRLTQQVSCYNLGGTWTLFSRECESSASNTGVFKGVCEDTDGIYVGCVSPCRNQINAEIRVCQIPCVNVCEY
jgi:hypothetical protein